MHLRWGGYGDLVQTVLTVHHDGVHRTQQIQYAGDGFAETRHGHAGELAARAGRVGDGPKDVEHGAHADLAAWPGGVLHGRVVHGREHEPEAGLVHAARDAGRWQIDGHADRLEEIGRAAGTGDVPVAVLGNPAAG